MQTKPKSNSVITHSVEGSVITMTVLGAGTVTLDTAAVSAACRDRAAIHGFIQRLSDGAAMSRDPETGKPATAEAKLARIQAIADHYATGTDEWRLRVAVGGTSDGGLLFRALMRAYPDRGEARVREFLAARSAKEKRDLLVSATLRPHVDAIRAEQGRGIDADAILADL
jgi:hypothetical protein